MALPEYVVPVLGFASVSTLTYAAMRGSENAGRAVMSIASAVMMLIAGITAIITCPKDKRSELCRKIVKAILRVEDDDGPPQLP